MDGKQAAPMTIKAARVDAVCGVCSSGGVVCYNNGRTEGLGGSLGSDSGAGHIQADVPIKS